MKVILREVASEDWRTIYLNDKKVLENHNIDIQDICEKLQNLIDDENAIDLIKGKYYYLDDEYAEEYGFPEKFSDIPKDILV